ncbi:hydroxymethylglutaryl-CoA reductase, degradative [Rhodococcus sp. 05-2255-3B1]|uniref:hydroxymethylglutaryl-CoA reductase, degradative n=1 Tax=unclassified Rhodococcus (in: high G+C Gram-positive bacteria) TaxID=192944 RepID=UPI000B9AB172|nr:MULTISPECIES: hydroxymethylglutaryl-CoA reductase, degradative [unclassified Rhodococcus (in: high G+C Gram-positive bacteria)]OZE01708.1 hydroxymethylglutaryl-CoA reductase, degradative [Rhodococcus sp. 05-2255-3C]OZE07301.1 hydroxymethylglutaryl-CoA reductase, degradative [Rhodococcus sp. 05-2255-3B1]OZE17231.1 hydroxymethylglutaryl-CoA reductase, degradative [Rhodococcus sp. 05-2255-2A2]
MTDNSRIPGLKDSTVQDRRAVIAERTGLEPAAFEVLEPGNGLDVEHADHMIENVIGVMGIPVGIATNFTVNGRDYLVPMATEEPSVVAAASNAARMARGNGGFFTSDTGSVMQAQIQLLEAPDPEAARFRILEARSEIIDLANAQDPTLVKFGGGALDLTVRVLPTRTGTHVIVHLVVDVRDAMGANAVNTMAEAIAPRLAEIAGGRSLLRILTNKADHRIVRVRAVFDKDLLGGDEVVDNIVHASAFAEADPYRAATHNKGIMNGITAAVLATGNDTRAVEAGCHSHAVGPDGRYTALSHFEKTADGHLSGALEVPMAVGLVGGATKVHPVAQTAVKILGVTTATELAQIIAAVGLAQNLGACRALAAEGIQRGHMSLHARTVAATAGATSGELDLVVKRLIDDRTIRVEHAEKVLAEIRSGN